MNPPWGRHDHDLGVRQAAFLYLAEKTRDDLMGTVTWGQLRAFSYEGTGVPLIGARGIWKPRVLDLPISVATAPPKPRCAAPYEDQIQSDGTILYRYCGTDPDHRDNVGVRLLYREGRPLIYLAGIERGLYMAFWPTFVVHDDPNGLTFTLAIDAMEVGLSVAASAVAENEEARRRYITVAARHRIHQASFRLRVLRAYRRRCAVCRLGHERLLDAAHIVPDQDEGLPVTRNGLSLCKIHHAAFDENILGVDPDYRIHIRRDILDETDGPMLQHGLQRLDGNRLVVLPRLVEDRPDPDLLDTRFEAFRKAE